jgi:hypothetical protein
MTRSDYEALLIAIARTSICDQCYLDVCEELANSLERLNPRFSRSIWFRRATDIREIYHPNGVEQ